MRSLVAAVFTVLLASTAFAQQKNEFTFFVTDATVSHSSGSGTNASASLGLAFDRMVTPRVSAQLSVASERHHTYSYVVRPDGSFQQITPIGFRTYPIDFAVRYHFMNDTRWKPYLGLGARYVRQPYISSEFGYHNHFGPEIVGGTEFRLGRSFGLVLDGKIYLGDREQYDSQFKPSFGLNWRF